LRYFVVECTTTSAPSARGRCRIGDRNVLSTTVNAPAALARAATADTSVVRSNGLDGVSTHTMRVLGRSAASSAAGLVKSAYVT